MQMVLITDQKCVTGKIIYVGRTQNHATTWGEQFFRGRKIVVQVRHGHSTRKVTMYIRADTTLGLMHIPRDTLRGHVWELQVHGQTFHQGGYGVIYIDSIQPTSTPVDIINISNFFD